MQQAGRFHRAPCEYGGMPATPKHSWVELNDKTLVITLHIPSISSTANVDVYGPLPPPAPCSCLSPLTTTVAITFTELTRVLSLSVCCVCSATSSFVKVNCTPWFFAVDLFGTVDFESSKSVVKQQTLEIHFEKVATASVVLCGACVAVSACYRAKGRLSVSQRWVGTSPMHPPPPPAVSCEDVGAVEGGRYQARDQEEAR